MDDTFDAHVRYAVCNDIYDINNSPLVMIE